MNRLILLSLLAASLLPVSLVAQPTKNSVPFQWVMQQSGTTAGLRGIDSVDGKVAWASGTDGTVLRTTDGGEHWTRCATPDANKDGATLDFRGVQAWDAQTAIVMASGPGDKSRLYKTADGCRNWNLLATNKDKEGFWDSVSVADQMNLMILGDPVNGHFEILETSDGGSTWIESHDPGLKSAIKGGAFAASNSALAINWVDGPAVFGSGGPSGALVFQKCDSCKSIREWQSAQLISFPKGESAGIFSLNYRDWRHWLAVGGDYTKPNESSGTAAYSIDGALHWAASVKPPHGYRSAVQWSEDLKAWITVGTNGSDISYDDGKTWQPVDNGNWNALSFPFVVGPKGHIARLEVSDR